MKTHSDKLLFFRPHEISMCKSLGYAVHHLTCIKQPSTGVDSNYITLITLARFSWSNNMQVKMLQWTWNILVTQTSKWLSKCVYQVRWAHVSGNDMTLKTCQQDRSGPGCSSYMTSLIRIFILRYINSSTPYRGACSYLVMHLEKNSRYCKGGMIYYHLIHLNVELPLHFDN